MKEISELHFILKIVILDQDDNFTSIFGKALFARMDKKLNFTTDYRPQIEGKTKKAYHVLKVLLRM